MKDENTKITPELVPTEPNTTLNENDTVYDLLPTIINKPPVIVQSITEASTPQIKASNAAVNASNTFMYRFPDGNVKVHTNTTIILKVVAEQPDIYNVENGELVLKKPTEDLIYRWTIDGESIVADDEEPSLQASRTINGNEITITNMIPKYAGVYNCTVSNDIGATDGGTVSLEVFNSDIDDLFYTNLIQNPNGTADDGSLTTEGWESVVGNIQAKQLSLKTEPDKHKKIVTDPFNPEFEWTSEMLFPKTYQIDGGSLRGNAIDNLTSYFTRTDYNYKQNGEEGLFSAYQDIDLTDLQSHIQGAIYGINGVRAVLSFYLGMAIYNYTPAFPYIDPETRTKSGTYFLGAPRLSFENFIKAGPGFVREVAYVEVEEYDKEERLQSTLINGTSQTKSIRAVDPWNKRLPQYNNQVYYQGGTFQASPDEPSKGDNRDKHLFVADELFPNPNDRFTYGQYAELNKIVLDKLHPRTNKLRIVISIEPSDLVYRLREQNKIILDGTNEGLFEEVSWGKTYKSLSVESNNSTEREREWIGNILDNFRKSEPLELRIPKASDSKAFMSGFNLALIPLEADKMDAIDREVDLLISKNTRVPGRLPSTLRRNITFDARDKGNRNLDVSFEMSSQATINVSLKSTNPDIPDQEQVILGYSSGLFPFTSADRQTLIQAPTIQAASEIQMTSQKPYGLNKTNGVLSPTYIKQDTFPSLVDVDIQGAPAYTVGVDGEVDVTYRDGSTTRIAPADTPLYLTPKQSNSQRFDVTQLNNSAGTANNSVIYGMESTDTITPIFPQQWYNISSEDKLAIYNNQQQSTQYTKWSTPQSLLNLSSWYEDWNNTAFTSFYGSQLNEATATWSQASRFIITVGVHNTNLNSSGSDSIHSTETYYLDFIQNNAVLHKTPNLGGNAYLPGFSKEEEYLNDPYTFLNLGTNTFEPYVSDNLKTYTTKFLEEQQMNPAVITITTPADNINNTATFTLPQSLLTGSRLDGGLNIPTIQQDGATIADPSYEVILYGVRPATAGEFLLDSTTLDSDNAVGTPLAGSDDLDNTYRVVNISVSNNLG